MSTEPKHGDRVQFAATLHRVVERRPRADKPTWHDTWKVWRRLPSATQQVRAGIFLGWRALRDGVRDWEEEVGPTFKARGEPLRAALVSFSPHRKPVYVHADDVVRMAGHSDAEG